MATTLQLKRLLRTNTTETFDLNSGSYQLGQGWKPAVSRLKDRAIGGEIYEDVEENIPIRVFGADEDTVLSALQDLYEYIEQSDNWNMGGWVNPITIHYRPNGSTLSTPVQALVIGSSPDAEPIALTAEFNETIQAYEAFITLSIIRRGRWLGAEETASSSSAAPPSELVATFSDNCDILSPVRIEIDGFNKTTLDDGISGIVIITDEDIHGTIGEAEDFSVDSVPGSGTFNTVTDSAASGGEIRQLVPNSAGTYIIQEGAINPAFFTGSPDDGRYALFMSCRNNSTTISYEVQWEWEEFSLSYFAPKTTIDTSHQRPRIHFCGLISTNSFGGFQKLNIVPSGTGGSSEALDIDYVVLVRITENTRVINFQDLAESFGDPSTLVIDHSLLTHKTARFFEQGDVSPDDDIRYLTYTGNIYMNHKYAEIAVFLMANTYTNWLPVSGTSTALSNTLTAIRRKAYLVPR